MKKSVMFECKEQEILDLINENIAVVGVDSLVALEELGNQVWCVKVAEADEEEVQELTELVEEEEWPLFQGRLLLNYLCKIGILEAGTYNIDCTW